MYWEHQAKNNKTLIHLFDGMIHRLIIIVEEYSQKVLGLLLFLSSPYQFYGITMTQCIFQVNNTYQMIITSSSEETHVMLIYDKLMWPNDDDEQVN